MPSSSCMIGGDAALLRPWLHAEVRVRGHLNIKRPQRRE